MQWIEGYLAGISMVVFIGPVFFTLLKSSLQYNRQAGFAVATGIIISDIVCVCICSLGILGFFYDAGSRVWLAVGGSILLAGMGIRYLLVPVKYAGDEALKLSPGHYAGFFIKGFLVNFINPFVFLVWIGLIGYVKNKYPVPADQAIFLGATLAGILTTDLVKVILARQIKKIITPRGLKMVSAGCGIVLIGFGIRLALYVFFPPHI